MKILLTGGAGFIGSHLVEGYIKNDHNVIVVDNLFHPVKNFKQIIKKTKLYKADICDFDYLKKIFKKEKPQAINHHAAQSSISSKGINLFKTNVLGTLNLLKLSKEYKVKKFIFASSAAVYGHAKSFPIKEESIIQPISEYGISKASAEYYINLFKDDFNTIIFRYSNVYGPRQDSTAEGGVISIFSENIKKGKQCLIFGNGKQTRDFINVKDVVNANLKALKLKKSDTFNISTAKETSIIKLLELFYTTPPRGAAPPGGKKQVKYLKERAGEIRKSLLDNSKAKKNLFWRPRASLSFPTGLPAKGRLTA